jgi:hypothetical protein
MIAWARRHTARFFSFLEGIVVLQMPAALMLRQADAFDASALGCVLAACARGILEALA